MSQAKRVDVLDMVREYLERPGYHGLYNGDAECACLLKDLSACENLSADCTAGWMAPCDCGAHAWHLTSVPPGGKKAEEASVTVVAVPPGGRGGRGQAVASPWEALEEEPVSALCRRTRVQACHLCDDLECEDNASAEARAKRKGR
jgi:hypothetical protein